MDLEVPHRVPAVPAVGIAKGIERREWSETLCSETSCVMICNNDWCSGELDGMRKKSVKE